MRVAVLVEVSAVSLFILQSTRLKLQHLQNTESEQIPVSQLENVLFQV